MEARASMSREWYFVRRIRAHERPGSPDRFEIQVLGDDGSAVSVGYIGGGSTQLMVDGHAIPAAVIEAAKRREEGQGAYVGSDGRSLPPF